MESIRVACEAKDYVDLDELEEFQGDLATLSDVNFQKLEAAFLKHGITFAVSVWYHDGKKFLLDGHARRLVLKSMKERGYIIPLLPAVIVKAATEKEAKEKVLLARSEYHQTTDEGLFNFIMDADLDIVELEPLVSFQEIDFLEFKDDYFNNNNNGSGDSMGSEDGALRKRFIIPPFSIFDTRQGYWLDRKRQWEAVLKTDQSKNGREDNLTFSNSAQAPSVYELRNKIRAATGKDPEWSEIIAEAKKKNIRLSTGTSIFDPVLCEVCYRWFCPDNGIIIDPFSGGSVRGMVASYLSYQYHGVDIRQEQINENYSQVDLLNDAKYRPSWYCGNSVEIDTVLPEGTQADFIFSCPPYFDLEKYSDSEEDLSNMTWEEFSSMYRVIIEKSVALLNDNRFACFVVGDIRDKKGFYRNFINLTIESFQNAGAKLYNYMVLVNVVASLAIRANSIFNPYRKVGKQHQDILVFYKGDPKKIKENYGEVIVDEFEEE